MKGKLRQLFVVEFRRQWTIAAMIAPFALAGLSFLMFFTTSRFQKLYDVARTGAEINLSLVVPLAACLFAVGLVSNDVKEGWLRTLLIRPVTRQQYLLVRLAAVFSSVVVTLIVAGVLPNIVVATLFAKGEVRFDLGMYVSIHAILILQSLLYLAILTFFSCWLPGFVDVAVLGLWGIFAGALGGYLQMAYWTNKWLTVLKDYLFPSGFSDAIDAVKGGLETPWAQLAWGFAALGLIAALAFWSVSKIQVDKSSE